MTSLMPYVKFSRINRAGETETGRVPLLENYKFPCYEVRFTIRNVESNRGQSPPELTKRLVDPIPQPRRIGVQRRYATYALWAGLSTPLETRRVSGHEIPVSRGAQVTSTEHISMHSVGDLWVRWCSWETNIPVNEQSVVEAVPSLRNTLSATGRRTLRGSLKRDAILSGRTGDRACCRAYRFSNCISDFGWSCGTPVRARSLINFTYDRSNVTTVNAE